MAVSMAGRTVVITGANAGIGLETTMGLARMGARVVMVARNRQKGQVALEQVRQSTGSKSVEILHADLSNIGEVRRLAGELLEYLPEIHALVNNAGVFLPERRVSKDGFEMNLAVNCLAPFVLTHLLLERMKASGPARVVNVSSSSQQSAKLDWSNLQAEKGYSLFGTYGASKLLALMWSYELARRLEGQSVTVNALHPGSVNSNLGDEMKGGLALLWRMMGPFLISPENGAKNSIWAVSSPDLERVSGQYFVKEKAARSNPLSYDLEHQKRAWTLCSGLSGLDGPQRAS